MLVCFGPGLAQWPTGDVCSDHTQAPGEAVGTDPDWDREVRTFPYVAEHAHRVTHQLMSHLRRPNERIIFWRPPRLYASALRWQARAEAGTDQRARFRMTISRCFKLYRGTCCRPFIQPNFARGFSAAPPKKCSINGREPAN
jgi:hypothetical protein